MHTQDYASDQHGLVEEVEDDAGEVQVDLCVEGFPWTDFVVEVVADEVTYLQSWEEDENAVEQGHRASSVDVMENDPSEQYRQVNEAIQHTEIYDRC